MRLKNVIKTAHYSYADSRGGGSPNTKKQKVHLAIGKVLEYIQHTFTDVMKCPSREKVPRPALMWQAGVNIYFGKDKAIIKVNGVEQHFERYAYARGSGTSTIGIHPNEYTVHPWIPALTELWDAILLCLPEKFQKMEPNGVSMKFYDKFMLHLEGKQERSIMVDCGIHRDMQYNVDGGVGDDSSQTPDTDVVIVTYGGQKWLNFKLVTEKMTDTEKKGAPSFKMHQTDARCTVLDHRDEKWKIQEDGGPTYCFYHSSEYVPNEKTDMQVSIMFRCIQKTVVVGQDHRPVEKTEGEKVVAFENARLEWMNDVKKLSMHTQRKLEWLEKLKKLVRKTKP